MQTNQKFDMNVIIAALTKQLKLKLKLIDKIEFKELSMKTTDHNHIILYHWIWIRILIEDIIRNIKSFVASNIVKINVLEKIEHLSLILELFWFYAVNAFIFIKLSQIFIKDTFIEETVRAVTDSELVFYKEHNLLLYSKTLLKNQQVEKAKNSNFEFDNDDEEFEKNFWTIFNMIINCEISLTILNRDQSLVHWSWNLILLSISMDMTFNRAEFQTQEIRNSVKEEINFLIKRFLDRLFFCWIWSFWMNELMKLTWSWDFWSLF